MGMKSKDRRNFEAGVLTTDKNFINLLMKQFDDIWTVKNCKTCGRKDQCVEWRV